MSLLTFKYEIDKTTANFAVNYSLFKSISSDLTTIYNSIRTADYPAFIANKTIHKNNLSNNKTKSPYKDRLDTISKIDSFIKTIKDNYPNIHSHLFQDLSDRYYIATSKLKDNQALSKKIGKPKPLSFPKEKKKDISSLIFKQYNSGFRINLSDKTIICNSLSKKSENCLQFSFILNKEEEDNLSLLIQKDKETTIKRDLYNKSQQHLPKQLTKKEKEKYSKEELEKISFRKDFVKSDEDYEIKTGYIKEEKGKLYVAIVVDGPFTKDFSKNIEIVSLSKEKKVRTEVKIRKINAFSKSKRKRDKARKALLGKKHLIQNINNVSEVSKDTQEKIERIYADSRIPEEKTIAMDFGCGYSNSIVLSNGMRFCLPFNLYDLSLQLRKLKAIYNTKGRDLNSNHSIRMKEKIEYIERRIVNIRKDFLHKISKFIIKYAIDNDIKKIFVDNISSDSLARSSKGKWIRKQVYNNSFSTLKFYLQYKTCLANKSKTVVSTILVDPAFSSQFCPLCLTHHKKELSDRIHICEECLLEIDRDIASAILMDKVNRSRFFETGTVDKSWVFDSTFEALVEKLRKQDKKPLPRH